MEGNNSPRGFYAVGCSFSGSSGNDNYTSDAEYLKSIPIGYRFKPTDVELLVDYLKVKINGNSLPPNLIFDVNIYDYNPQWLSENFPAWDPREWYFFSRRDKKYKNGTRPNRATGDGYWKASGADKQVRHRDRVVGLKRTLNFLVGKPCTSKKTEWLMHEFRVIDALAHRHMDSNDMKLDECVLCKIYTKNSTASRNSVAEEESDLNLDNNEEEVEGTDTETDDNIEANVDIDLTENIVQDPSSVNHFLTQSTYHHQQLFQEPTALMNSNTEANEADIDISSFENTLQNPNNVDQFSTQGYHQQQLYLEPIDVMKSNAEEYGARVDISNSYVNSEQDPNNVDYFWTESDYQQQLHLEPIEANNTASDFEPLGDVTDDFSSYDLDDIDWDRLYGTEDSTGSKNASTD